MSRTGAVCAYQCMIIKTAFFFKFVDYQFTADLEEQLDEITQSKKYWKNIGKICEKRAHNGPSELSAGHREHRE